MPFVAIGRRRRIEIGLAAFERGASLGRALHFLRGGMTRCNLVRHFVNDKLMIWRSDRQC